MKEFIVRRTLAAICVMLLVSMFVFVIMRLVPGDPARQILGQFATEEEVTKLRHQLGLDLPLPVQYWRFLTGLFRGDLGISYTTRFPVTQLLVPALGRTIILSVVSMMISTLIGIVTGIYAAARFRSIWDYAISVGVVLGIAMPGFWFGLMLIVLFSLKLGWLPSSGYGLGVHLVLPTLSLAIVQAALTSQITKGSMLEVLFEDYIRTARAKGLSGYKVLWKHALRNALIPVVTVLGLRFGALLGGAVTIEVVFAWPGIGRLIVDAALSRDYPVVVGGALVVALCFVIVNYVTDIVYGIIDPRMREVWQYGG